MFDVTEPIGGVHAAGRLGYRSGYYSRSLTTRVGVLGLAFRVIRSQAVLVAIGVDRDGGTSSASTLAPRKAGRAGATSSQG